MKKSLKTHLANNWLLYFVPFAFLIINFFQFYYIPYLRNFYAKSVPQEWSAYALNGKSNMLVDWVWGEEILYAAKINKIRDTGYPEDPFLGKEAPPYSWLTDCITFYFTAFVLTPYKNLETGWMLTPWFIFIVWFFIFFYFLRKVFKSEEIEDKYTQTACVLGSLIPLLGADFFNSIQINFSMPNLGKWLIHTIGFGHFTRTLLFFRMTSPFITFFLSFNCILFLILYLNKPENNRSRLKDILWGSLIGLFLFIHFFEWAYFFTAIGVFSCAVLFFEDYRAIRKSLLTISLSAGFISACILLYQIQSAEPSVVVRAGIQNARIFSVYGLFLFFLGLALLHFWKKQQKTIQKICGGFLSASIIGGGMLLNASLITGKYLQNQLFARNLNFTLSILVAAGLILVLQKKKISKAPLFGAIFLILTVTFFNTKSSCEKYYKLCGAPQTWDEAMDWINTNLPRDIKILTLSTAMKRHLAVYTHSVQLTSDDFPVISKIPTEQNLQNFATLLKTLNVNQNLFLEERFSPSQNMPNPKIMSNPSLADFEIGWDSLLLHHPTRNEQISEALNTIHKMYETAQALKGHYYVVLNSQQKKYLNQPLELSKDFNKIFSNPDIEIFEHNDGNHQTQN